MAFSTDPTEYPPRSAVLMSADGTLVDIAIISQSPTVSASPAYSAGDVVGSKLTFSNGVLSAGGKAMLQAATVNCKSAQTAALDLILFNDDPAASTFTDNAALSIAAADFDKIFTVVHITDWTNLGTPSFAQAKNEGFPYSSVAKTMYGVLVARAAMTLGSTSDIKVTVRTIRQ
jgi:hypothetical protein